MYTREAGYTNNSVADFQVRRKRLLSVTILQT
jgi:hypothetical protein